MTIELLNFGCRLNAYESQVMKNHAEMAGLTNTILVNSCAVTKEAERQTRQAIRRAKRKNPDVEIIVSGCAAQIDPEAFASMPEVSKVLGNEEKLKPESYQKEANIAPEQADEAVIMVNDIMSITETASHLVTGMDDHTRAFVQVQNGCNHRCTFCIIPYGRGNSRSVPMVEIIAQVRALVEHGYQEVVITGVDISDYGKDLQGEPTLGQMLRRLLAQVPGLPRLRVSSIDAVEVDDDFFLLMAEEPRLMPHMHVSLQAGDDMILKRMKRRHLRQDAVDFVRKIRAVRPDTVFGADIIAGFPTETEAMFQNTLNLVDEIGLTYLHVFPYSERPGTPAARMPQVAPNIRKERAARLREAGEAQRMQFLRSRVGKMANILVEKDGQGHCEHYAPVMLASTIHAPVGSIIQAKITAVQGNHLQAG